MSYLESLYAEKKRFEELKSSICSALDIINKVIDKLEIPVNNLEKNFMIDDLPADSSTLRKIREDLETRRDYLNDDVISSIDSEISDLNDKIEEEEAEEEEAEELKQEKLVGVR